MNLVTQDDELVSVAGRPVRAGERDMFTRVVTCGLNEPKVSASSLTLWISNCKGVKKHVFVSIADVEFLRESQRHVAGGGSLFQKTAYKIGRKSTYAKGSGSALYSKTGKNFHKL